MTSKLCTLDLQLKVFLVDHYDQEKALLHRENLERVCPLLRGRFPSLAPAVIPKEEIEVGAATVALRLGYDPSKQNVFPLSRFKPGELSEGATKKAIGQLVEGARMLVRDKQAVLFDPHAIWVDADVGNIYCYHYTDQIDPDWVSDPENPEQSLIQAIVEQHFSKREKIPPIMWAPVPSPPKIAAVPKLQKPQAAAPQMQEAPQTQGIYAGIPEKHRQKKASPSTPFAIADDPIPPPTPRFPTKQFLAVLAVPAFLAASLTGLLIGAQLPDMITPPASNDDALAHVANEDNYDRVEAGDTDEVGDIGEAGDTGPAEAMAAAPTRREITPPKTNTTREEQPSKPTPDAEQEPPNAGPERCYGCPKRPVTIGSMRHKR